MNEDYKKAIEEVGKTLNIVNPMAIPHLSKITVNIGVKDALTDKKNIEKVSTILGLVTGQKPKVNAAKKSIATFKLREGDKVGLTVTLRGKIMLEFFNKLVKVVLPRIRDFRGVKLTSFDGKGNYTLGMPEYTVFPEIDPGKVEKVQGLEISIVTSASSNEHGVALLRALGMPFVKGN